MTRAVVSYDVFDTVVTRAFAHPRDVFVHLGAVLGERGLCPVDAMEFARARWAAELRARELSPWTEVLLDDIYRELSARLGWNDTHAALARNLELEIESRHLRGVPLILATLAADRAEAGRLVFLSDMYLPTAVLRPWLEREGVAAPGDLLLISGEARGNKSSGALFATAQKETGGNYAHWRHSGDNEFADVGKPRQLGITVTHLTHGHLTPREQSVRATKGEFAPPWRSLLAGAMRLARLERRPTSEREAVLWEVGTSVAGPLFYGFVRWTLAEAERRGVRRLYFLARDSQIFWRIARVIQQETRSPVECRYLYGSRLAFAGPAELDSAVTLRELAMPNAHFHSLRQALVQLGLDEAWAAHELPAPFATLELDANLPRDTREQLAAWLLAPERRSAIQAGVELRAAHARRYLESAGLRAGEPVALVDAGWLGSIHRNLERILGQAGAPAPLTGFYLGLLPPQAPLPAGELAGYTNLHAPLPLLLDPSHKVLVELLAQSDHGQVTGFRAEDGGYVPVLKDPGPVNLDEIRLVQDAALAFTRRMLETANETKVPSDEFARTVIGLYRDFHDHPAKAEAKVFGFLPHADQLFEQKHATLCGELSLWQTLRALANYRRRPPQWWIQGQAALGHGGWLRTFRALKRLRRRLVGEPE